jgi:hypothetical protein
MLHTKCVDFSLRTLLQYAYYNSAFSLCQLGNTLHWDLKSVLLLCCVLRSGVLKMRCAGSAHAILGAEIDALYTMLTRAEHLTCSMSCCVAGIMNLERHFAPCIVCMHQMQLTPLHAAAFIRVCAKLSASSSSSLSRRISIINYGFAPWCEPLWLNI